MILVVCVFQIKELQRSFGVYMSYCTQSTTDDVYSTSVSS